MNEILERLHSFINEGKSDEGLEPVEKTEDSPSPNMDIEPPALPEQKAVSNTSSLTRLIPKASDIPVPSGGVGVLLAVALLIIFALAKAPGQKVTRLQLIWKAFLGTATLGDSGDSNPTKALPSLPDQWSDNPAPGNSAIGNPNGGIGAQWGGGFY